VANSCEVSGRIEKFYRRDATVIYPLWTYKKSLKDLKKGLFFDRWAIGKRQNMWILLLEAVVAWQSTGKVLVNRLPDYGEELQEKLGKTVAFLER